jgi:hypothetical protein
MAKHRKTKKRGVRKTTTAKGKSRRWSQRVTDKSDALVLEQVVFKGDDPKKIAQSLKRSAKRSHRKKGTPFQSAMSMLNFYINRAGDQLPASKKKVLEDSKDELRVLFGRETKDEK